VIKKEEKSGEKAAHAQAKVVDKKKNDEPAPYRDDNDKYKT